MFLPAANLTKSVDTLGTTMCPKNSKQSICIKPKNCVPIVFQILSNTSHLIMIGNLKKMIFGKFKLTKITLF